MHHSSILIPILVYWKIVPTNKKEVDAMLQQTTRRVDEFYAFKENMDSWIKEFNGKIQKSSIMNVALEENINNTNHNYEMVQKMQHQMEELQQEVKTLKLMQLLSLKRSIAEKKE